MKRTYLITYDLNDFDLSARRARAVKSEQVRADSLLISVSELSGLYDRLSKEELIEHFLKKVSA